MPGTLTNEEAAGASENQSVPSNLPVDGAEWVELFVREMMSAASVDDARARAAKVLEVLEKSISSRAGAEAAQSFQKVSLMFMFLIHSTLYVIMGYLVFMLFVPYNSFWINGG